MLRNKGAREISVRYVYNDLEGLKKPKKNLVPFLTTMEVMMPLENYLILSGKLIQ